MLRFIITTKYYWQCCRQFQYIPCYGLSKKRQRRKREWHSFQYIPCYGLSVLGYGAIPAGENFNTSHVTVYRQRTESCPKSMVISIHPMLRFIRTRYMVDSTRLVISIHPMLRFIHGITATHNRAINISIHPMLRFISKCWPIRSISLHFNTSHVTVYHQLKPFFSIVMKLFQYIPCYGLSFLCNSLHSSVENFNTSHVTVYRYKWRSAHPGRADFNTSHVTVYQ